MMLNNQKKVNLALQGGGSHGAFTWGVLSQLLDDERLQVESISGVSSGAMNACALASGFVNHNADGAKQSLASFWQAVSAKYADLFESNPVSMWDKVVGFEYTGSRDAYLSLTQNFSPYQLNPFNLNPLRDILVDKIDFDYLQKGCPIKLHIGATQLRTGKLRVFTNHEITADVLLASACLPSLHQAIEIEGEHYWDGGYSGNPPLFPLIFNSQLSDIIVVLLQPLIRESVPKTVDEIQKRSQELMFTNTFMREMRAIALSKEEIKHDWLRSGNLEKRMSRLNIHIIEDAEIENMDSTSRYSAESKQLKLLYLRGLDVSKVWISNNYRTINKSSSVDLVKLFG